MTFPTLSKIFIANETFDTDADWISFKNAMPECIKFRSDTFGVFKKIYISGFHIIHVIDPKPFTVNESVYDRVMAKFVIKKNNLYCMKDADDAVIEECFKNMVHSKNFNLHFNQMMQSIDIVESCDDVVLANECCREYRLNTFKAMFYNYVQKFKSILKSLYSEIEIMHLASKQSLFEDAYNKCMGILQPDIENSYQCMFLCAVNEMQSEILYSKYSGCQMKVRMEMCDYEVAKEEYESALREIKRKHFLSCCSTANN
jgi:hypothetical protein